MVNKVILLGRLGSDPEIRYTANGSAVANINLATNRYWKDQNGERQEKTDWHKCVVWGKQAEIVGKYLKKGRLINLEGRLESRSCDDKDGNKRYTTEVIVNDSKMLNKKESSDIPNEVKEIKNKIESDEDDLPF